MLRTSWARWAKEVEGFHQQREAARRAERLLRAEGRRPRAVARRKRPQVFRRAACRAEPRRGVIRPQLLVVLGQAPPPAHRLLREAGRRLQGQARREQIPRSPHRHLPAEELAQDRAGVGRQQLRLAQIIWYLTNLLQEKTLRFWSESASWQPLTCHDPR